MEGEHCLDINSSLRADNLDSNSLFKLSTSALEANIVLLINCPSEPPDLVIYCHNVTCSWAKPELISPTASTSYMDP